MRSNVVALQAGSGPHPCRVGSESENSDSGVPSSAEISANGGGARGNAGGVQKGNAAAIAKGGGLARADSDSAAAAPTARTATAPGGAVGGHWQVVLKRLAGFVKPFVKPCVCVRVRACVCVCVYTGRWCSSGWRAS
jgi:hypothetical protein